MFSSLKPVRFLGLMLAMGALTTAALGQADSWVQAAPDSHPAVSDSSAPQAPQLEVLSYDESGIRLTVDLPGVALLPSKTKVGAFVTVTWPDAAVAGEVGMPALPVIRRLFIVQPDASVAVNATLGAAEVIDLATVGAALPVIPRQAPIPKIEGAIESAPFNFDPAAYAVDADYLTEPAILTELGVARGQRLFLLEVHPVTYNPATQTLTLRSKMDVTIQFTGGSEPFSRMNPLPGLERIVLNPDHSAPTTRGSGNYLIITPTAFESQIASFATHKAAKGFTVNTYVATSSNATTIKNYIQSLWGGPDAPDYILLVGDTQHIGYWVGGGDGSPDTDLPYTCMDGASDWLPDIAIGRFPADDAG